MSKWSTNTGFQRELLNFGVRWLWGIDLDHSVYWIIHFATSLESLGVQEAQDREAEGEVSKQTAWRLNGCNLGSLAGLGVASWEHWTLRSSALRQRVENAAAEQTPSPSRLALMGSTFGVSGVDGNLSTYSRWWWNFADASLRLKCMEDTWRRP